MKKLALTLNALLAVTTAFMFADHGMPHEEEALLVLLMFAAPIVTLYAFRSHFFGNAEEKSAPPDEKQTRVPVAEQHRFDEAERRKPLYEWLESVEDRLDAIEARATEEARAERPGGNAA